jgi:hypothetical protein
MSLTERISVQRAQALWNRLIAWAGDGVCPPEQTLSTWMDDELDGVQARRLQAHAERCVDCCEQVLGWLHAVAEVQSETSVRLGQDGAKADIGLVARIRPEPSGDGQAEGPTTCLDEETLVAYSEAALRRDEAGHAEEHLKKCVRCVSEVQRLIGLRVAMEVPPAPSEAPSPSTAPNLGTVVAGWLAWLAEWLRSGLGALARPWPAAGLVAVTALAVVVIARLLPMGDADVQLRGAPAPVKFEVIVDGVVAHARPSDDEAVVAMLSRGTILNRLEESQGWTRIELPDGRRVWVRSEAVSPVVGATP